MKTIFKLTQITTLAWFVWASPNSACALSVVTSTNTVELTTNFNGQNIEVVVDKEGEIGDIILMLKGDAEKYVIYKKEKLFNFWHNTKPWTLNEIYNFYHIKADQTVIDSVKQENLKEFEIGLTNLQFPNMVSVQDIVNFYDYRTSYVDNKSKTQEYFESYRQNDINNVSNNLVKTQISIPSNISSGTYNMTVMLVNDGDIQSLYTTPISVTHIGIEKLLADLSNNHKIAYLLLAIFISFFGGICAFYLKKMQILA